MVSFGQDQENNAEGLFYKAVNSYNNKDYNQSIEELKKSINLNENGSAVYYLGENYAALGNYEEALKYYFIVINNYNIDKNLEFNCYKRIGERYLDLNKFHKAIEYFTIGIYIIKDIPSDTNEQKQTILLVRGLAYKRTKNFESALSDYNEALTINPNYLRAYEWRGTLKYENGDNNGACSDWLIGAEKGDKNSEINYLRLCN